MRMNSPVKGHRAEYATDSLLVGGQSVSRRRILLWWSCSGGDGLHILCGLSVLDSARPSLSWMDALVGDDTAIEWVLPSTPSHHTEEFS
jgi:hypothetical protein